MFIGDATNNAEGDAMAFFRRFAEGLGHSSGVAGLAEAAPTWGWEPVDGDPFESGLTDMVHDVARTLHGVLRSTSLGAGSHSAELGRTMFHDAYWGTVDDWFFLSSRRRHTRLQGVWSSDVCSSDLAVYAKSVSPDSVVTTTGSGRLGIASTNRSYMDTKPPAASIMRAA